MLRFVTLMAVTLLASGCADQGLRTLDSNSPGPDEFLVQPSEELVIPEDLATLPQPTPGQGNRTDPDVFGDMIVALGGRPSDPNGAIPSSDGALVSAASRLGVSQDIRGTLAAEDAEFRKNKGRFSQIKIFPEDVYNQAYKGQSINPHAEADAWRRAGADTPSFPPPN